MKLTYFFVFGHWKMLIHVNIWNKKPRHSTSMFLVSLWRLLVLSHFSKSKMRLYQHFGMPKHETCDCYCIFAEMCWFCSLLFFVCFWGSQAQAGLGQAVANSLQDHYKSYHDDTLFGDSQVPKLPLALGASKKGAIMITVVMVLKAVGYSLAKASLSRGASKKNEDKERAKPTHVSQSAVAVACFMFRHTSMPILSHFWIVKVWRYQQCSKRLPPQKPRKNEATSGTVAFFVPNVEMY